MKRYLKFAASFWMSAFLVAGSLAGAQTTSVAKTKKKSAGCTTSAAPSTATHSPSEPKNTEATTVPTATTATQNGTTTPAPKMMIGPDKTMIPVPEL
jgi:hypothetical protein